MQNFIITCPTHLMKNQTHFHASKSWQFGDFMFDSNSIQSITQSTLNHIPKWFPIHLMNKKSKFQDNKGLFHSATISKLGKIVPNKFSTNWSNQSSIKHSLNILNHPISSNMLKIKFTQFIIFSQHKNLGKNISNINSWNWSNQYSIKHVLSTLKHPIYSNHAQIQKYPNFKP